MSDKKNYNFTQYPKHVKYYGQKLDRLMISYLWYSFTWELLLFLMKEDSISGWLKNNLQKLFIYRSCDAVSQAEWER